MNLKQFFLTLSILLIFGFQGLSQSARTKKLYNYCQSKEGVRTGYISKDIINLGLVFLKDNASLKKLANDIKTIQTITIIDNNLETGDIEALLPNRKYELATNNNAKPIILRVKQCFFKVKEIHYVNLSGNRKMIISVIGNFKIKDLKQAKERLKQNDIMSKLPMIL